MTRYSWNIRQTYESQAEFKSQPLSIMQTYPREALDSLKEERKTDVLEVQWRALEDPFKMTDANMQNIIATFFFVAYMFLIVVAMCGAVSVVFIVLRYRNLRSRPINFYYVNMAFADLFLAALGAPFRAVYYLKMQWTFGVLLCQWFEYAESLAFFVHVYSLMMASFLVLQDVLFVRRSYRRTQEERNTCLRSYVVTSFGVWTFGILVCLPYITHRIFNRDQCQISDRNLFLVPERIFGPLVLIVIPVSVTILAIFFIICCACSTNRVVSTYQENILVRAHKSTRHISLFLLIFILCQVPYTALKWFKLQADAQHDTLEFCAAGLRLASACFSAAFFCYISEEKVLFNVRHAMGTKKGPSVKPDKIPLRSVSDTQYREENQSSAATPAATSPGQTTITAPMVTRPSTLGKNGSGQPSRQDPYARYSTIRDQPETYV
ncbi:somatostatin receptor type 2 [Galendromus occidentalis]|uniref:Somatostatin receptor type 2 n=1 Tax=Galendromus occidentalis TaxID=34638 RepID=A0AAJ7L741_9ACAR|nr:somatostatin receptor type 2 [Galendromus occidentalis]